MEITTSEMKLVDSKKADVFPNDHAEIADCHNDGVGDNADARSPQIIAGLEAQIAQQAEVTERSKRPTLV